MAITIYWSFNDQSWLRAEAPEPIYKNFVQDRKNKEHLLILCPAVKDYMRNTFSLKSIFSYDFKIDPIQEKIVTDFYDQGFFENHVKVRSLEDKLFSFMQRFCFYTEEKSLLMSGGIFPFLEDNDITKRCTLIPGTFDIGKWFRQIEFAFYLKDEYDEFKIKEGDIYQYIKFHTDEKIIFKQFKVTPKLQDLIYDIDWAKDFRVPKLRSLEEYYSMMKHKKMITKEIKNNLVN